MAENTGIEWAHDTLNPWVGCQRISPACDNCYAASMARRFTPEAKAWDGTIARTPRLGIEQHLKRLEGSQIHKRIFVGSMTDVALVAQSDPDGLADLLSRIYRIQYNRDRAKPKARPLHTWIMLTKRPAVLRRFLEGLGWEPDTQTFRPRPTASAKPWPSDKVIPGLMIGVTAENQEQADRRIPELLKISIADMTCASVEPMLGPVSLHRYLPVHTPTVDLPGLDWVIDGGETGGRGVKTRPMHPEWVDALRAQVQAAGVPFFFKAWGDWTPQNEDTGRRDGTLGIWAGPNPYQWMPCISAPPAPGYPMMAKLPKTERPALPERPKELPAPPEPGQMKQE